MWRECGCVCVCVCGVSVGVCGVCVRVCECVSMTTGIVVGTHSQECTV